LSTLKKTIQLAAPLSYKEWKRFGSFLNSPFFGNNKKAIELYDYLNVFHPDFYADELQWEFLHGILFDSGRPNKAAVRHVCSDLNKLLEQYCTQLALESDRTLQEQLLAQYYSQNNQAKLLSSQFKKQVKTIQGLPQGEITYFERYPQ